MQEEKYFSQFKLPKRNWHWWHLIKETNSGKLYYIHTSGHVAVRYKNGKEKLLTSYFHKKYAMVKIQDKAYKLKNLVAMEVFPQYRKGMNVINIDGNPLNCDFYNLKLISKSELGKLTGGLSRSQEIQIGKASFPSVRQASKSLFVSHQTLLDFLKTGKSKTIDLNLKIKYKNMVRAGKFTRLKEVKSE